MSKVFKRKMWMRVIAVVLAMALNLGALDGIIRYTVQELAQGSFAGFAQKAEAKNVEAEKNKNSLPASIKDKPHKNAEALEAAANHEVAAKRTLNSKTFKINDNNFKTEVYQDAIHYLDQSGKLSDIDNTLVETREKGFDFENKANSVKMRFVRQVEDKKLGRIQMGQYSIEWSVPKVGKVSGDPARNTITYSGIMPQTDLRYTVDGSKLKEDIILNGSGAPDEFEFRMDLNNLAWRVEKDGSLAFYTKDNQVVWVMPKPYMYDTAGNESSAIEVEVDNSFGQAVITLKPDQSWLASPERQYPVVIDPTIQPGGSDGRDTFISSMHPDTNYRAKDLLYVGETQAYGNTKSFFRYDGITVPDNAKVTSATFSVFATKGELASARVYPVGVNWEWNDDTLNWRWWQTNSKLGPVGASAGGGSSAWWNFDVTGMVQNWAKNPSTNYGLALQAASGTGYKELVSCDHGSKTLLPKLEYTYAIEEEEPPATPANFKLHIDRKTGLIKADGTAMEDARIFMNSSDGQSFRASADSSGNWVKTGMNFAQGKAITISMYYEYDVERTDDKGNTYTETITSDTSSQKFLIAIYSKGARTKKLAKFYWNDGTKAAQLNADNEIKTELEMVVGDYVLVLDPMRDMPYTVGTIVKDPDEKYRLREKLRPLYSNGEVVGDSIDAATGNFFALETDLGFDAVGLPIEVTRVLNSQEEEMYRGPLGQNWKFSYDKMLIMYGDGSIEATGGDGGGYFFRLSGGEFVSDSDVTDKLEKAGDGTYSLTTKYNTVYHFNIDGMLDSITDRNGNSVTLGYDPEGLMTEVKDAGERITTFSYDDMGRIFLIEDPEGRQVDYSYDSGVLSEVSDLNGGTTSYGYDPGNAHLITQITDPMDYTAVTNVFNSSGQVETQTDAENYSVSLQYNGNKTTFTDKNKEVYDFNFNDEYQLLDIVGPAVETGLPVTEQTTTAQALKFNYGRSATIADPETRVKAASLTTAESASGSPARFTLVEYHYDPNGYRDRVTDAKGHAMYFSYDARGNLHSVLNDKGKGTSYEYNDPENRDYPTDIYDAMRNKTHIEYYSRGNVEYVTNAKDETTFYTYYDNGLVKTVTDPLEKEVMYDYYPDGAVKYSRDGMKNYTYYYYDKISRLTEVAPPKGSHTYYEYDDNGNMVKEYSYVKDPETGEQKFAATLNSFDYNNNLIGTMVTDRPDAQPGNQGPDDEVTIYHYNKRGELKQEVSPLGYTTTSEYDGNGNRIKAWDAENNLTQYHYDALGWLKQVWEPNGEKWDITEYYYEKNGNRVGVKEPRTDITDLRKKLTVYKYDELNRLEKVVDQESREAIYTYDDLNNVRYYKDFDGTVTEYKYDKLSRVEETIDEMGNSTKFTYDKSGNRETVTNARQKTYRYKYDDNNNLKFVYDPDDHPTEFFYDQNNNRFAMKDALGNTTNYDYDDLNRLWKTTDPLGQSTSFGFDKSGRRASVTDGNKHKTNYRYDADGRLRYVIDARQKTTEYKYNKTGNLRFFIDANKNETEYRYNSKNLLTLVIDPLKHETEYKYDENGNLKTKKDNNGITIEYDYDEMNRLKGVYYPDQSYVEYGYNDKGRREWMEDKYGTTWYDYDDLGRMTTVTTEDDRITEYEYNAMGQKTLVRYPDLKTVEYKYDNLNRLETVIDRLKKETVYEYDDVGRRAKTRLPNGVVTSYDYNIANQLTGITSINAKAKVLEKYGYDYDDAGNRNIFTRTVGDTVYTTQYFYDPMNELETVINPDDSKVTYEYDNAGNRKVMTRTAGNSSTTTKYQYDKANQLSRYNVNDGPFTEFKYDNNGNRTTKIEPDNRITSYQYDFENCLTEARFHQGKWAGFEYDGDGNRITKYSAMTQPTYGNGNKTPHDDGIGNDPGYVPPGQNKAKKQQANLQYMLLSNGNGGGNDGGNGGGNGGGNDGGNGGGNGGGNDGGNGGGNGNGNGGDNGNGNGNGNGSDNGGGQGNGNGKDNSENKGNSKDKVNSGNSGKANGKSGDKVQNKDLKKEDREAKKEKAKAKNGYRQKGKYTNKGKHKGWYKNGKLPSDKVDVTYYLNDVSDPLTQVLMTYGEDGKYDAAYTYGLERIEVEDIDETRPESQDPLYYLYDGLGSVTYMVKPDGNMRDHYRYDEYGKPAPGNSKLSPDGAINLNNTFGYTGEMWDEETNLLYLRARYYEPETGRFLSRDTYKGVLENPLSRNLYAYVRNNPLGYTDKNGHMPSMLLNGTARLYINGSYDAEDVAADCYLFNLGNYKQAMHEAAQIFIAKLIWNKTDLIPELSKTIWAGEYKLGGFLKKYRYIDVAISNYFIEVKPFGGESAQPQKDLYQKKGKMRPYDLTREWISGKIIFNGVNKGLGFNILMGITFPLPGEARYRLYMETTSGETETLNTLQASLIILPFLIGEGLVKAK